MSNERIDLTELEEQFKDGLNWDDMNTMELIAELKRCYEKLDMAESALTEIWAYQIDNVGGYNVTEILLYYEKAHGLNIRPDASE
jgi:acyl carrier protein